MSLKSQDPGVLTFFDQQLVDRLNAKTE
ncbi:MAG: hypothetical protein ACI9FD_004342, partial [Gammaproteobacteria bacterium]